MAPVTLLKSIGWYTFVVLGIINLLVCASWMVLESACLSVCTYNDSNVAYKMESLGWDPISPLEVLPGYKSGLFQFPYPPFLGILLGLPSYIPGRFYCPRFLAHPTKLSTHNFSSPQHMQGGTGMRTGRGSCDVKWINKKLKWQKWWKKEKRILKNGVPWGKSKTWRTTVFNSVEWLWAGYRLISTEGQVQGFWQSSLDVK